MSRDRAEWRVSFGIDLAELLGFVRFGFELEPEAAASVVSQAERLALRFPVV